MFRLSKRRKFILTSILLTFGFFLIHFGLSADRFRPILGLSILTILLSYWSLGISPKNRLWLLSWILPFFFTLSVALFYFLLPTSLVSLIPILAIYLIGMYVLLLSENIFFVASIRTIQLYRAASAVGFLFSLITAFFLYDTTWSLRLPFYFNGLLIFLISFFLLLHGCWIAKLEEYISFKTISYSAVSAYCLAMVGVMLSFWPISISLGSLFITSLLYVLLGLSQAKLNERLFNKTVREYVLIGISVFLVILFYTRWG